MPDVKSLADTSSGIVSAAARPANGSVTSTEKSMAAQRSSVSQKKGEELLHSLATEIIQGEERQGEDFTEKEWESGNVTLMTEDSAYLAAKSAIDEFTDGDLDDFLAVEDGLQTSEPVTEANGAAVAAAEGLAGVGKTTVRQSTDVSDEDDGSHTLDES